MNLRELPEKWRAEADAYERDGVLGHALLLRRVADGLARAFADWELEALTLAEAEAESGYARSSCERMIKDGKVENVGEPGAPRVRRCDLPRKPGRGIQLEIERGDLADEILARRQVR